MLRGLDDFLILGGNVPERLELYHKVFGNKPKKLHATDFHHEDEVSLYLWANLGINHPVVVFHAVLIGSAHPARGISPKLSLWDS